MSRCGPFVTTGAILLVLMSGRAAFAATATASPTATGSPSYAATAAVTATPTAGIPARTAPYALDFTLPTFGKSGCEVCHGDPNLIRIKDDQYISYYVPPAVIDASAHGPGPKTGKGGVLCTSCHLDFASTSQHADTNWQRTSKQACRNCHTAEQDDFAKGAHSVNVQPGQTDPKADQKPLCGDCHGGHGILKLDAAGKQAMHASGWQMCGRCHPAEWADYSDYYHGAAYRKGAPDAPACWDCHGSHDILASKDPQSPTNADNLGETCGKCHQGVDESFLSYAGLIHRRVSALDQNPMYSWMHQTSIGISAALNGIAAAVRSWFT
jgi:nitrate/TMAO reductase-like tetraheme cytochrome c subunit